MNIIKYELYEDNEGGLALYLLDDDGNPKSVYDGWELAPEPGIMLDVVADLENGIKLALFTRCGAMLSRHTWRTVKILS